MADLSSAPSGVLSTDADLIPTFDRQKTSASAATSATLWKQWPQYLGLAPVFNDHHHSFYSPIGLVTTQDTYLDVVSWSAQGGKGEAVEIQNAAGHTLWRGMATAVDDSSFASVRIGRLAKGGYQVVTLDSGRLDVMLGRIARNSYGGRSN